MYLFSFSGPNLLPSSINPTLQEFFKISIKFCGPCPVVFQHFIVRPATTVLPLQLNELFSSTSFSSIAAVAVITLKIDPGSKVSLTALFRQAFWFSS